MTIRNWSTTAASNNAAPPNGFPEGMAPSAVNNAARQVMAEVRDTFENLPYFDHGHTPTRIDADTFTVATDLTALYIAGRTVKLVGASTQYATITSSSYSAPDTTVNVIGTVPTSLSTVSLGLTAEPVRTAAEISALVTPTDYSRIPDLPVIDARRHGVVATGADMTTKILAALSVAEEMGGAIVQLPHGSIGYDGDLILPDYTDLIGVHMMGTTLVGLSNAAIVKIGNRCNLRRLTVDPGTLRASSVGVQLGLATQFKAWCRMHQVRVKNHAKNVLVENAYFAGLEWVDLDGGTVGLEINPTAGSGLGFVTTISTRKLYVHNMTGRGIYDRSTTQSQQMHFIDQVVEQCGDATGNVPQVELAASTAFSWDGGYIESTAATKPDAIIAYSGTFSNFYINGYRDGMAPGASAADLTLNGVNFFNGTRYPINMTGGANAYLKRTDCYFDRASNLSCKVIKTDQCDGTLETGVSANSFTISGSTPLFNVGGSGGDDVIAFRKYSFTANQLVGANSTVNDSGHTVGSGALAGNTILFVYAQGSPPAGLTMFPVKASDNGFVMRYVNSTATPQTDTTDYIVGILRFA